MKSKIVSVGATIFIAFTILLTSLLRCVTPNYAFSPMVMSEKAVIEDKYLIDYPLPFEGEILPDNPLWYIKVLRDKLWYIVTFNTDKKVRLNILFADKRLNASLKLFEKEKPDLGTASLSKSGKYMEKAEKMLEGKDNKELLNTLAQSSLKHRQVIEDRILPLTPEDLRAEVIKIENYSKLTFINVKNKMLSIGLVPPENPFKTE